jgi:hypothetical protein
LMFIRMSKIITMRRISVCDHPLPIFTVAFGAPTVHPILDCFGFNEVLRWDVEPVLILMLATEFTNPFQETLMCWTEG